jgi:hypothetical protein
VSAVLSHHRLRQNLAIGGDQRHGAIVAGGLKAKDYRQCYGHFASGPLPEGAAMH